jgi:hypothetical protein
LDHFVSSENVTNEEYKKFMIVDLALDYTGSNAATLHGDGHVRLWAVGADAQKGAKPEK